MDEVDKVIDEILRHRLSTFPGIVDVKMITPLPVGPVRLAVVPFCDRSRPPYLFCIYDEHGQVVIDDC